MRVVTPPLVAFFCFLLAALAFVGFSSRLSEMKTSPTKPRQSRVHVFVDMSPSVSGSASTFDLGKQAAGVWASLAATSRLTLSTSHSKNVSEPASAEEASQVVQALGFHRAGVRIGTVLKSQLEKIGEVDRLILISDRDQHSWAGFNWSYLQEDKEVFHLEVGSGDANKLPNVFFSSASFLSTPMQPTMDWDIELARRGPPGEMEGTLKAMFRGTQLASTPVKFAADRSAMMVRVSWPSTQAGALAATAPADEPIIWQLEMASGDSISSDNEYRTALLGLKKDILLIGEPSGEQSLDDPANSLQVALNVLGFQVRRVDTIVQPGPRPDAYPLWIVIGGGAKSIDSWCPHSIETARLEQQSPQGARGFSSAAPKIWLVPYSIEANYQSLCTCYHRLLLSDSKQSESPEYCKDLNSRKAWTEILPGIGAKQVGGEVGQGAGAIAWRGQHQGSGLDLLAFTVPLRPMVATGITHADLPLLIKNLLSWQKILLPSGVQSGASWPRVADIAEVQFEGDRRDAVGLGPKIILSNIPVGESLLNHQNVSTMPPKWGAGSGEVEKSVGARRDRQDPIPWLNVLAGIIVFVTGFEAMWLIGLMLIKFWNKKRSALVATLLLAAGVGSHTTDAHGQVSVSTVRTENTGVLFTALAREVAQRTSIELGAKPQISAAVDELAMEQPWIWVTGIDDVVNRASGDLKPEIALWIKRGGFLVIDRSPPADQLEKLTQKVFGRENFKGVWQPIPPDHEVMRSFYLLDALPMCQNQVWQGFQFDGRLAILTSPYKFLDSLSENAAPPACTNPPDRERSVRVFVNLMMVALATDYKKDQIHLPEILKRLR